MTTSMTVATEIYRQLGGRKFVAMTGATMYSGNNTLVVKFKGSKVANYMTVTLNSMDLYDVKISKYRGMNIKEVESFENVYADMLQDIFTRTTGLATRL